MLLVNEASMINMIHITTPSLTLSLCACFISQQKAFNLFLEQSWCRLASSAWERVVRILSSVRYVFYQCALRDVSQRKRRLFESL